MKSARNRSFSIVAGVLTAFAIILSQLFYFQGADFSKKEIAKEKQEKKATTEESGAFIAGPVTSVLSSVQVDLNHKTFLLFEILFPEKEEGSYQPDLPITLGKYFHTLFHIIISPNAP